MKKKFIILTLCFTVLISSFNYKKVYAMDLVITPVMLGVITTVAVAGGVLINSDEDIINLGRVFYEHNKENWTSVNDLFKVGVSIGTNKAISVSKDFLDVCKDTFDSFFSSNNVGSKEYGDGNIPFYSSGSYYDVINYSPRMTFSEGSDLKIGKVNLKYTGASQVNMSYYINFDAYVGGEFVESYRWSLKKDSFMIKAGYRLVDGVVELMLVRSFDYSDGGEGNNLLDIIPCGYSSTYSYNYEGSWDNSICPDTDIDKEFNVPKDLSSLVGVGSSDVLNPSYPLVGGGSISYPGVLNPSIDVAGDITFPGVIEGEGENGGVGEGEGEVGGEIAFPSFGDSINFSPFELSGITEKFPFSLPWDIGRLIGSLNVEPKAPIFDVPIVSEKITVDLTSFDEWANIVRWFLTLSLIATLIYISVRLKG